MKVYVASSWRNHMQRAVVHLCRSMGHEVYDFREPTEGNTGFSWGEIDTEIPKGATDPDMEIPAERIRSMLCHPIAGAGFALDMDALRWCDACVLVLPCGRSAHLEAGWAAGAGKLTIGLLTDGPPDLMWKMLDHLIVQADELFDILRFPAEAKFA
jgi:hypothetical protein